MSRSRASLESSPLYASQSLPISSPDSPWSGTGMRGVVDGSQALAGHVRVDLGASDVGVSEELLHAAQVRTALEQVRRERVTEQVRPDRTSVEGRAAEPRDDAPDVARRH